MSFRLEDKLGSKIAHGLSLFPLLFAYPLSPVDRNIVEVGMDVGVGAGRIPRRPMRFVATVKGAKQELADQGIVTVFPAEADTVMLNHKIAINVNMSESIAGRSVLV